MMTAIVRIQNNKDRLLRAGKMRSPEPVIRARFNERQRFGRGVGHSGSFVTPDDGQRGGAMMKVMNTSTPNNECASVIIHFGTS